MKDFVPLGTGNSRFLRSVENFMSVYPTYADFAAALAAGTLPIDLNGINEAGISQKGTALNKYNLLKDATVALFGLDGEAVPDDVLNVLSRFHAGLGNEYVWAKYADGQTPYIKESTKATSLVFNYENGNQPQVLASCSVAIQGSEVVLVDPETVTLGSLTSRYYKHTDGVVYRVDSRTSSSGTHSAFKAFAQSVDYASGVVGYVNSPDINAYPQDDGYTYEYLGQLGNKVQIATGSYMGTGKYGSSNPNSLTFDFEPKVVIVGEISTSASDPMIGIFVRNVKAAAVIYAAKSISASSVRSAPYVTWSGNVVIWYSSDSVYSQLNNSGFFTYIAIG